MKTCLAIACEDNYLPGLHVLVNSMTQHGKVPSGIDRVLISSTIKSFPGMQIHALDPAKYAGVSRNKRYSRAYFKLEALRLPYKKIVVLDADLLCLGDISDLFVDTDYDLRAAPDHGIQLAPIYKNSFVRFNSGVCVFAGRMLAAETWKTVTDFGRKQMSYDGGDQGALNEFVFSCDDLQMDVLHSKYNTLKRLFVHQQKLWKELEGDIRLLHFVGTKPWEGERKYEALEALWRRYR